MRLSFFLVWFVLACSVAQGQNARVQLVHNAPDAALDTIDVYWGDSLIAESFTFREATPFLALPADSQALVFRAGPGSDTSDPALDSLPLKLNSSDTLVGLVQGLADTAGFVPNPEGAAIGLQLHVFSRAVDSATSAGQVSLLAAHGIPDAPTVAISTRGGASLFDSLSFGGFAGYINVAAQSYLLDLVDTARPEHPLRTFRADLSGLADSAVVVFASGFLDSAANNNGPAAGLFAALPSGAVVPLPEVTQSQIRLLHASPDNNLRTIDAFLNGTYPRGEWNDLGYRQMTGFVGVDVSDTIELSLNLRAASGPTDRRQLLARFNLLPGERYTLVANGVVAPSLYQNNPDGISTALNIEALAGTRTASVSGPDSVDLRFFHAVSDANALRLNDPDSNLVLSEARRYRELSMYRSFDGINRVINLVDTVTGQVIDSFAFSIGNQNGSSNLIVALGFQDTAQNQGGPVLQLFAYDAQGNRRELPPIREAELKVIHNAADPMLDTVDLYVDGRKVADDFSFRSTTDFLQVASDKQLRIDWVEKDAATNNAPLISRTIRLDRNEANVLVASGVLNPQDFNTSKNGNFIRFQFFIDRDVPRAGATPPQNDIVLFHGLTDFGTSDFRDITSNQILSSALRYADFSSVLTQSPQSYVVSQQENASSNRVEGFFDGSQIRGERVYILSGGFFAPGQNQNGPEAALFAVVGDSVFLLPELGTANIQLIHNAADPDLSQLDIYIDGRLRAPNGTPFGTDNIGFRESSNNLLIQSNRPIDIGLANPNSNSVADTFASFSFFAPNNRYLQVFLEGVRNPNRFDRSVNSDIGLRLNILENARRRGPAGAEQLDLAFHQGATDVGGAEVRVGDAPSSVFGPTPYGGFSSYERFPFESGNLLFRALENAQETVNGVLRFESVPNIEVDGVNRLRNITLFTTGFADPSNNPSSGNAGPALRLAGVLADGTVFLLDEGFLANLQFLHTSADPDFDSINVFLNGDLLLEGFEYQESTPLQPVAVRSGNLANEFALVRGSSSNIQDSADLLRATFEEGENYVVFTSGLTDPENFVANPLPFEKNIDARLVLLSNYQVQAEPGTSNLYFYNAITDAPAFLPRFVASGRFMDTITFNTQADTLGIPSSPVRLELNIVPGNQRLETYRLALDTLAGQSMIVALTGFLDVSQNPVDVDKDRTVLGYLPGGEVIKLDDVAVSVRERAQSEGGAWKAFPNPADTRLYLRAPQDASRGAVDVRLRDVSGKLLQEHQIEGTGARLSVAELPSGFYLLEIQSEQGLQRRRVLVK